MFYYYIYVKTAYVVPATNTNKTISATFFCMEKVIKLALKIKLMMLSIK